MLKKTKFYFVLCILGIFANSGCDVDTGAVSVSFVCSDGAKKCDNNNLLECVNNRWKNKEDCSFECINIDANNAKCGECKSGAIECDENDVSNKKYKLCQNGEWRTGNDWICQKGCFNGECSECDKDFCNPVSKQYFQCETDGKYVNKSELFDAMCSEINTTCERPYCEDGEGYSNGIWCETGSEMKSCQYSCHGDICGECINGEQKCIEKNGNGKLILCANGSWGDDLRADDSTLFEIPEKDNAHFVSNCNGKSCNADKTDCGGCYNFDTRCVDNKEQTCANGAWGDSNPCSNGCNDETGMCETESECNDDKECSDGKMCHDGRCVEATCSGDNAKIVGVDNSVIENCAENKICVANEGEPPSCECDSTKNYEDDGENGCKCKADYEDSGSGCVKKNNCSSCPGGCFNGKCIECKEGKLYADDNKLENGDGVILSMDENYGCIDNKPFACHKEYDLKKYEVPYGCANDTDIFKCENGELVKNAENNFCGMHGSDNALFACFKGDVKYILTDSEYNSKYNVCGNGVVSLEFNNQYIYCFNKGSNGNLFEFIGNKAFLSELEISCDKFTDLNCSCDSDGYGKKKCYKNISGDNKPYCFYQQNGNGRYYCNCNDKYVQLDCPSGTFEEYSSNNYRCM